MRYKVVGGKHTLRDEQGNETFAKKGDIIDLDSPGVISALGPYIERLHVDPVAQSQSEDELAAVQILAKSIPDLKGEINAINDVKDLETLRSVEEKGKAREGVFKAIDARIEWVKSENKTTV